MNMNELILFAIGCVIGGVVMSLWARMRTLAAASAGHAKGLDEGREQGEAAGRQMADLELATLRERLSNTQADASRANAELENLSQLHQAKQTELNQLTERCAHLQVHADRVPVLDAQVLTDQGDLQRLNEALTESKSELAAAGPQLRRLAETSAELGVCEARLQSLQQEHSSVREQLAQQSTQVDGLTETIKEQRQALDQMTVQREADQAELRQYAANVADLTARVEAEQTQSVGKIKLLQEAKDELSAQFLNVANQVLEDKSQRFTQQNQENLGAMLTPLQERIKDFEKQVATTYDNDSKDRLTLKLEMERLAKLNTQMSQDAVNLTQALKGSNKTQGVWGEMALENVLESSGLRKGEAYTVQASFSNDEGQQQRPDVVINLPGSKHLIVDAKVSLVAYERICSAPDDATRAAALKEHLLSLRTHVKGLSDKNYPGLKDLKTPDFVLLFIPIEPAFMLALAEDHSLVSDAYGRNVMIVSPSTLMATLRTISNIWQHEYQNRNAQAIAEQCSKLYDKFVGFVNDLEQVGRHLGQTQSAYEDAKKKLSTGGGNLVSQVGKLKALGVSPTKSLPGLLEECAQATDIEECFAAPTLTHEGCH